MPQSWLLTGDVPLNYPVGGPLRKSNFYPNLFFNKKLTHSCLLKLETVEEFDISPDFVHFFLNLSNPSPREYNLVYKQIFPPMNTCFFQFIIQIKIKPLEIHQMLVQNFSSRNQCYHAKLGNVQSCPEFYVTHFSGPKIGELNLCTPHLMVYISELFGESMGAYSESMNPIA